ncbi:Oidioi.mRNA.OKI2018_I69.chr2.g7779.t1.cds [Oikopleura dioica]|uniref:Oidioi.mRNA.OKI2018_I69.chr2.g7779.t1.cds n=1 Tax=Oikopleura dioica TaxID=34765 RepID=A0ABN7TD55_OIKDI|nr:Oidioi.mRNA.OKI2018_I69.chr2.g7779.t1.cds [Oikopleura dioica]
MKVFKSLTLFFVASGSAVSREETRSWSCMFDCVGALFRGDVYCSYTWEFESEDYYRCLEPYKEEFDSCIQVDGCLTLGPCWEKCVPPALEGSSDCEDGYENGDLNEREFLRCLVDLSMDAAKCLSDCDPSNP